MSATERVNSIHRVQHRFQFVFSIKCIPEHLKSACLLNNLSLLNLSGHKPCLITVWALSVSPFPLLSFRDSSLPASCWLVCCAVSCAFLSVFCVCLFFMLCVVLCSGCPCSYFSWSFRFSDSLLCFFLCPGPLKMGIRGIMFLWKCMFVWQKEMWQTPLSIYILDQDDELSSVCSSVWPQQSCTRITHPISLSIKIDNLTLFFKCSSNTTNDGNI